MPNPRYRTVTTIDSVSGLPSGFSSWETYKASLQADTWDHNPTSRDARLRECEAVLNGTASWDLTNHRWVWPWENGLEAPLRTTSSPYIPATMISSLGLPNGYISWVEYRDIYCSYGRPRLDDRLRECDDVISGKAIWNLTTKKYTWSWESQMATKQPKLRTFLFLAKYIKKNKKTLTLDSKCWEWLRKKQASNLFLGPDLLKTLNKYINHPDYIIVLYKNHSDVYSNSYGFTKHLSSYYTFTDTWSHFFYTKATYKCYYVASSWLDSLVKNKKVFKENNLYYTNSCKALVYNALTEPATSTLVDSTLHNICTHCERIWYKEHIKYSDLIEKEVCPICNKSLANAAHNSSTLFSGYHSHKSSWKFLIRRLNKEQTLPMGIEIEMHPKGSYSAKTITNKIYEQQLELNKNWHEFYFEHDGSLAETGIECVTNPMTLDFAKEYWATMLPVFRKYCVGWKTHHFVAPQYAYGIHLTTSTKYWTRIQLARTLKFFEHRSNQPFLHIIAQRNYIYGTNYWAIKDKPTLMDLRITLSSNKNLCNDHGKYSPINLKGTLVEFRMFASTLNQESFMKNYEFLDAFWHWVRTTSWSLEWKDFIQWLASQPNTSKRWPNLVSYIYRTKFFVKANGQNTNTYVNIILPIFQQTNSKILVQLALPDQDLNHVKDEDQCV